MSVYEQQARALKEIAAELKGIRRALDIIGKSMKPNGYRADITIVDELAGQENGQRDVIVCPLTKTPCGDCKEPDVCPYRVKEVGADG